MYIPICCILKLTYCVLLHFITFDTNPFPNLRRIPVSKHFKQKKNFSPRVNIPRYPLQSFRSLRKRMGLLTFRSRYPNKPENLFLREKIVARKDFIRSCTEWICYHLNSARPHTSARTAQEINNMYTSIFYSWS